MAPVTIRGDDPIPAKAGIGLRFQHHEAVLECPPDVAFMEVHTENYMGGGEPLRTTRTNWSVRGASDRALMG